MQSLEVSNLIYIRGDVSQELLVRSSSPFLDKLLYFFGITFGRRVNKYFSYEILLIIDVTSKFGQFSKFFNICLRV